MLYYIQLVNAVTHIEERERIGMTKQVMIRAWEIARAGQLEHGGKVNEYLSESLKIAWEQAKEEKASNIEKVMQVIANFDTNKIDLVLIHKGRIVQTEKNINEEDCMEKMAGYASGLGYSTMDHYAIVGGVKRYRGRHVATVRNAA